MIDCRIRRRELNHILALAVGTAVTGVARLAPAAADSVTDVEKHKPRYQEHSPEVQTFYRVNRYPAK